MYNLLTQVGMLMVYLFWEPLKPVELNGVPHSWWPLKNPSLRRYLSSIMLLSTAALSVLSAFGEITERALQEGASVGEGYRNLYLIFVPLPTSTFIIVPLIG